MAFLMPLCPVVQYVVCLLARLHIYLTGHKMCDVLLVSQ